MTKSILGIILATLSIEVGSAQMINLELANPHPIFQDADIGDVEFADIDNDGDQDLVMIGKGGPILSTIYLNDGVGNFTEDFNNQLSNVFNGNIGVSDIDDDGDLDLLITGMSGSFAQTNMYINNGFGFFTTNTNSGIPNLSSGDVEFADVDGDGDDDLFVTGNASNSSPITKLYLNNGNGVFSESTSNVFEQLSSRTEFFDCDGDNDLDLIITGSNSNTIDRITILYKNDGAGNFTEVLNSGFIDISGGDVAVGDTDNDGDLDVLISGNTTLFDIETQLFLNDGTGDFTMMANTVFSDVSLGEVSFNDFDNDGDQDVFVMGTGEGGLATYSIIGNIYENLGNNMFVVSDSLIGGYFASHAVADIDGDNDLDLIMAGTTISVPDRATWLYTNETIITVSLDDVSNDLFAVKIYPNPFQDKIEIRLSDDNEATLEIYSELGRLIHSEIIKNGSSQLTLNLPAGIYLAKISNEDYNRIQRIVSIK